MVVFIVIGAVGLAVLLLSLVLGDLVDLGDGDVSGTSLGAGAVTFGAIGTIVTVNGLPIVCAYVASALFAVLVMLGVQRLVRRLRETEDGVAYTLVGISGVVTWTVVPNGAGEVSLDDPRELERRLAWADTEIPTGARIVVVEQAGSRVKVTPA